MIKILVCSDNHGLKQPLDIVRSYTDQVDFIVHCGDSEMMPSDLADMICVRGNHEFYQGFDRYRILDDLDGHKILITHGTGMVYGDNNDELVEYANSISCDIVFHGHSHIPNFEIKKGVTIINPGSLRYNRDGSKPSFVIVTIDKEKISVNRINVSVEN